MAYSQSRMSSKAMEQPSVECQWMFTCFNVPSHSPLCHLADQAKGDRPGGMPLTWKWDGTERYCQSVMLLNGTGTTYQVTVVGSQGIFPLVASEPWGKASVVYHPSSQGLH